MAVAAERCIMRKGAWVGVWQMDVGVGGGVGMLYLEKRRRESRRRRRRYGVVGVEPSEARPWCNVQPCRLLSFFSAWPFFLWLADFVAYQTYTTYAHTFLPLRTKCNSIFRRTKRSNSAEPNTAV